VYGTRRKKIENEQEVKGMKRGLGGVIFQIIKILVAVITIMIGIPVTMVGAVDFYGTIIVGRSSAQAVVEESILDPNINKATTYVSYEIGRRPFYHEMLLDSADLYYEGEILTIYYVSFLEEYPYIKEKGNEFLWELIFGFLFLLVGILCIRSYRKKKKEWKRVNEKVKVTM